MCKKIEPTNINRMRTLEKYDRHKAKKLYDAWRTKQRLEDRRQLANQQHRTYNFSSKQEGKFGSSGQAKKLYMIEKRICKNYAWQYDCSFAFKEPYIRENFYIRQKKQKKV